MGVIGWGEGLGAGREAQRGVWTPTSQVPVSLKTLCSGEDQRRAVRDSALPWICCVTSPQPLALSGPPFLLDEEEGPGDLCWLLLS